MEPDDLPRGLGEDDEVPDDLGSRLGGVLDSRPKTRGLNRLIRTGRRRAARAQAKATGAPAPGVKVPSGRLTFELVPSTSRHGDVRPLMDEATWDRICRQVFGQADSRCEVCGGRGAEHPVECHEVWSYDDATRVQALVRMMALCPDCHQVKHIGSADVQGKGAQARLHLERVNGWLRVQTEAYVSEAFRVWAQRGQGPWVLDLEGLRPYVLRDEYLRIVRAAVAPPGRPTTGS